MKTATRSTLAVLLVLLAVATARGAGSATVVLPRLSIAPETLDAGEIKKGDPINAVFEVRNAGPATLLISEARPSCGCTVATFDREIAPGKAGKIRATVDSRNFSGPIVKTITVVSNDPVRPQLTLTVRADVRP